MGGFALKLVIISYSFPSIHCSMGSAPVGAQFPLTSSPSEFLGYWDSLWYPGLSPVLVLGSHRPSLRLPYLGVFYSLFFISHWISLVFFTVAVSAPHHQPTSLFQTWDWHYGNWILEKVEIPWWWSL